MSLRIRRGTEAQRTGVTFDMGEIVWTTDYQQLWVGDGLQTGGFPVVGANVAGYGLHYNGTSHKLEVQGLSADDLTNGTNNKFFSTELAQDAAASLFTTGSHTGISFQYSDVDNKINATVDPSAFTDTGLLTVAADTDPHLGGNLTLSGHNIVGTGNINITGSVTATGYGNVNSTQVTILDNPQNNHNAGLVLNTNVGGSTGSDYFTINTHHNDVDPVAAFFSRSRGTSLSPAPLQSGDAIFNFGFSGRSSDGTVGVAAGFGVDVPASPGAGIVPGRLTFYTASTSGAFLPVITLDNLHNTTFGGRILATDGTANAPSIGFTTDGSQDTGFFHPGDGQIGISTDGQERVHIDNGGMRVTGFMKVASYATGSLPSPAETGMIAFDSSTNQFKGYNGSSWVVLG